MRDSQIPDACNLPHCLLSLHSLSIQLATFSCMRLLVSRGRACTAGLALAIGVASAQAFLMPDLPPSADTGSLKTRVFAAQQQDAVARLTQARESDRLFAVHPRAKDAVRRFESW